MLRMKPQMLNKLTKLENQKIQQNCIHQDSEEQEAKNNLEKNNRKGTQTSWES